jgi:hypothetical protein
MKKRLSLIATPFAARILAASAGALLIPAIAFAQDNPSIVGAAQDINLIEIIKKGLAYAILIAGFLSVVFIFIGGISFILSGGDEGKIKQAVSTIRYAIIGLIVTILSVVIVATVGKAVLGFDIIQYINLNEILQSLQGLSSGSGSSSSGSLD